MTLITLLDGTTRRHKGSVFNIAHDCIYKKWFYTKLKFEMASITKGLFS
ncbi:protein of unknown function [Vibrio tapetis subsp. tapetis]|uniref:Uncharacterized protein n=1 Tax=Vibrio tapetis subsp. tapetis TaxID=1671868 RepID=A0A2N8ZMM3_9VIBR|nr:protein of unknown function [Vibrio tapetis subsp. tapetis]